MRASNWGLGISTQLVVAGKGYKLSGRIHPFPVRSIRKCELEGCQDCVWDFGVPVRRKPLICR